MHTQKRNSAKTSLKSLVVIGQQKQTLNKLGQQAYNRFII